MKRFKALCLCFSLLLMHSCTEPPPPTLNAKDRDLVDSLYRDSINIMRPILDSLCDLNFDAAVNAKVDSIMQKRLEEIRKQMERINRQN